MGSPCDLVVTGRSELCRCLNLKQRSSQEGQGTLQNGQIEKESSEEVDTFGPGGRPQESVVGLPDTNENVV